MKIRSPTFAANSTAPNVRRFAGQIAAGIYIVGGWVYSIGYVWSHWAGFWHFGSLAFYASIRAIFWPIIIAASLLRGPSESTPQELGILAAHARAYYTTGTATLETCRGAGVEWCSSERIPVPESINLDEERWRGVWHEAKSHGLIMCYQHVDSGFFTTRSLRFACQPIE